MIDRLLEPLILKRVREGDKIVVLYGARQVGKTTLAKKVVTELGYKPLLIDGDQDKYREVLGTFDIKAYKDLISDNELVFIDEAQKIEEIGRVLKILIDNLPHIKFLVTGSSSFELANRLSEPLTGRTWVYRLHPISFAELVKSDSLFETKEHVEEQLIYGSYPGVINLKGDTNKSEFLNNLVSAYLYRDVLQLAQIRHNKVIRDLLTLLALQIGSLVSYNELAKSLGIARETVVNYVDLLEKSFVIFRLPGFSRNLRKEVTKMSKVYFYDLGVRNALIGNLNSLKQRSDIGPLWENYVIAERHKRNSYNNRVVNTYFWRTHTGAELDYVEESAGQLSGYEIKYKKDSLKGPKTWATEYQGATFELINRKNFADFIS